MPENHETNIVPYRKKKYFNIGLLIFGCIFIYLVVTVIRYMTAPHITAYEVREGSILKDNAYTGLAIRQEMVVNSDGAGYINYCARNNSKVKVNTNIYALSNKKLKLDSASTEEGTTLTEDELNTLFLKIQNFSENFQEKSFSETYLLKNEIETMLQNVTSQSKLDQINNLFNSGNAHGMTLHATQDDGIAVFSVDGMEALTKDTVTPEHLKKENYVRTEFRNNTQIRAGDPVYKLVTDEDWTLVVELSADTAKSLKEKKYIKVRFAKDNQTLWAGLEIKEMQGKYLAYLAFDNSMIRYSNERYLDIELILEDESGLKVPKTAITTKDFYVVPKSYITQGGNSNTDGVLKQSIDKNGQEIMEFLPVRIYYDNEEVVYLDPGVFKDGDILLKPESTETYKLGKKKELKGVYNINKGYAVFKQVQILAESKEYCIVKNGNSYSLSNYDHIALDSKSLNENDLIF